MYLSSCVTLNCLIIDEHFLCQDMNVINCLFYFIYLIFNKSILFYFIYLIFNKSILFYLFYFIYFIFKEMFICFFFFLHTYILYTDIYHNNLHCNIKNAKM